MNILLAKIMQAKEKKKIYENLAVCLCLLKMTICCLFVGDKYFFGRHASKLICKMLYFSAAVAELRYDLPPLGTTTTALNDNFSCWQRRKNA